MGFLIVSKYRCLGIYNTTTGLERLMIAYALTLVFAIGFHNLVEIPMIRIAKWIIKIQDKTPDFGNMHNSEDVQQVVDKNRNVNNQVWAA